MQRINEELEVHTHRQSQKTSIRVNHYLAYRGAASR